MPPSIPKNAYTDVPEQHPNLILGSLQLLFWLFFRPTAWRKHITRIDSTLRPDFCLAELSKAQRQNPALRRLLIQSHLILPLSTLLLIGLSLLITRRFIEAISLNAVASIVLIVMTFGVALSLAIGVAVGIVGGITYGIAIATQYVAWSIFLVDTITWAVSIVLIMPSCIAYGMTGNVAGNLAIQRQTHSLSRQSGGVLVGIVLGIVTLILVSSLVSQAQNMAFSIMGVVAIGVASFIRTRQWRSILVSSLIYLSVSSLLLGVTSNLRFIGMDSLVTRSMIDSALFVLAYSVAERIAGSWAGATAGAILASVSLFL